MWRMAFITDCRPLAGVLSGTTVLSNPSLAPMFERISRIIFSMFDSGWRPARDIDDVICWHRREWNVRADYLVNYTMDIRKSWFQRGRISAEDFANANILVHTDGGTRAGTCSAAAWCVEAVVRKGGCEVTIPVLLAGTFITDPISSFTAEAIALEEAVEAVRALTKATSHQPSDV